MENLRWEALGGGAGVWITKEYGFTTDTLLLAWFARPKAGEACADFGTGCGVIPMLWRSRWQPGSVQAVELQEEAAALAARSVEKNGFSEKINVLQGDLRECGKFLPPQRLDLIACNPPYYPMGRGEVGDGARRIARHEESLTLGDLTAAARYALRWGGRLCVCLRMERLAEAMTVFRRGRMEPKRLQLVQSGPEKAPYLFLLECRHGGRPGLTAEPTLVLLDGRGSMTPQALEVYGEYRNSGGPSA